MSKRVQQSEKTASDTLRQVLVSVAVGAAVTILVLLVMSTALAAHDIPRRAVPSMATLAVIAGAFASGFACTKMTRRGGLAYGAVCGAAFCLLAMLSSFGISDEGFGVTSLFKLLFMLLGGMLGGVFGVNTRRSRKKI